MNVLVIGNGGREHAILLALKKSPKVKKLYCMKGNAGTAEIAENVEVDYMNLEAVKAFVSNHPEIDYFVVAPDDPLAIGLVDELEAMGKRCFGPRKNAAIIEASKAFSKALMKKYNIPTAESETFDNYDEALAYINKTGAPIVLKADGLALGKGVLICKTLQEAEQGLKEIMLDKAFGSAGNKIVIEECMQGLKYNPGEEVSVLAFTDGKTIVPMITSCDHKRANDNDEGLNTGGMGTFSPCPFWTKEMEEEVMQKIMLPTMHAMNAEGRTFKGCLYFGLMRTNKGVKVVEYNSRFGDPETQVVLPMLKTDLMEIFEAITDERLSEVKIEWEQGACVCVVLASGGYPLSYAKGKEIEIGNLPQSVHLVHAGTAIKDGKLVTSGGRVLGVVAKGSDIENAREIAYSAVKAVKWENMHYRTDIGVKYRQG
ncbi:MAG: phosphoribosylamine--glycine ligase [Clostridiales bacterium]|nr:phosphoribosylamine--glycine ligase [Clostridiales bacterium]